MSGPRMMNLALVPITIALALALMLNLRSEDADAASGPAHCQCAYDALNPSLTQDSIAHCICGGLECVAILPAPSSTNHETSSLVCK